MAPVLVIAYLATAMVATSPVAVTYQEWIRTYTARGGDAGFHEKDDWLGIAIPGGSRGGVSPGGLLRPKGVEEVRLSGAGVRNAHVVAVLRWPGVRRLYIQNCTGLDDTVFPSSARPRRARSICMTCRTGRRRERPVRVQNNPED